jgi:hypothetical protein
MRHFLLVAFAAIAACNTATLTNAGGTGGTEGPPPVAGEDDSSPDASTPDATSDSPVSDAGTDGPDLGKCVGTFGSALATGFGRIDGTLVAIVRPQDQSCPMPNSDHIILEVQMNGAVYRMVANVHSDVTGIDQRVQMVSKNHALPAPQWAEGQHLGITFDYVNDVGAHAADFMPLDQDPLVSAITSSLKIGDQISVYATTGSGVTNSTHLIHRNGVSQDGAIVIAPTSSSPKMLLFHFSDQSF